MSLSCHNYTKTKKPGRSCHFVYNQEVFLLLKEILKSKIKYCDLVHINLFPQDLVDMIVLIRLKAN